MFSLFRTPLRSVWVIGHEKQAANGVRGLHDTLYAEIHPGK
jgi:hypothetical protein